MCSVLTQHACSRDILYKEPNTVTVKSKDQSGNIGKRLQDEKSILELFKKGITGQKT